MYRIVVAEPADSELEKMKPYYRNEILDAIWDQLTHRPLEKSRRKYRLENESPNFYAVSPIWQLKVGKYRVIYDVSVEEKKVYIRAIREKPPEKRTEDIL